jgi:hypothetical protein
MESRFPEIKNLRVEECCIRGVQIEEPEEFYMQYAGLIIKGEKLIYINAFSRSASFGWKDNAITVCDGGNAWGVLYNTKTKKFYGLAINGV